MNVCIIGSYIQALTLMVDRLPVKGESKIGHDFEMTYGGKGSDMAVQVAQLGAETSFIAALGDDDYSHVCEDMLKSYGVDTSGIIRLKDSYTGIGFGVVDAEGGNFAAIDVGANKELSPAHIDEMAHLIEASDVVLVQLEIPLATALYAMKLAKKMGKITVFNPAPPCSLEGADLSDVDILTPNETEIKLVYGLAVDSEDKYAELAARLVKQGCGVVAITLGDKGMEAYNKDGLMFALDATKINAIDTLGAGDSFNGTLATLLAEGKELKEACEYACAAASLSCTRLGTVRAYGTREEIDAFIEEHK